MSKEQAEAALEELKGGLKEQAWREMVGGADLSGLCGVVVCFEGGCAEGRVMKMAELTEVLERAKGKEAARYRDSVLKVMSLQVPLTALKVLVSHPEGTLIAVVDVSGQMQKGGDS